MTARAGFAAACRHCPPTTRWIAIGPVSVRLDIAGPGLAADLLAPLAHLDTPPPPPPSRPDLSIQAWSVAESGVAPPPGPPGWTGTDTPGRYFAWFSGSDGLTRGDLARPFERALLDGLRHHRLHGMHAAVVMADPTAAGLMLVGANGSGKSTTTLAALADGMAMLGDDCVAIGDHGQAFSLYNTCCLTTRSQALLGITAADIRRPHGADGDAKGVLVTHQRMPGRTATAARIAAVVFPQVIPHRTDSRTAAIGTMEAMRRLMPALRMLRNLDQTDRPGHYRAVMDFVAPLPKFRLDLGRDPAGIAASLRALADQLTP